MASGSSSSSKWLIGTTGTLDDMELMTNTQQESNLALPQSAQQDPNADFAVVVPPEILLNPNRYVCEICYQGFSRDQNLSLHLRRHNLPSTLKTTQDDSVPRKAYLCPEPTCVYHNRSNAKRDFGGLKKHYLRKHCADKKYKCETCTKAYSVESDLKAHLKVCAKKICVCHCGSRFLRRNFAAHQETCAARQHESSALRGPQMSSIQNQSSSYPFTVPYQSQPSRFGANHSSLMTHPSMGPNSTNQNFEAMNIQGDCGNIYGFVEGRKSFFDGGFMQGLSSSRNFTPARHNLGLQEMFNLVTGNSYVGGHEQGPSSSRNFTPSRQNLGLEEMFNPVSGSGYVGGCEQAPSSSRNFTPPTHNLGLQEMFNPVTGSSYVGGYEQAPSSSRNFTPMTHNLGLQDMFNPMTGSSYMGGYEQGPSSSRNFTPTTHNLGLQEIFNPVTGSSDVGSYEQEVYKGYDVGSGPFEYSVGVDIFNFQHQQQQPPHSVNFDPTSSNNLTPARHDLGLYEMVNPMTGSSDMGGYEQEGYEGYGVGIGNLDYGGIEMSNFQHQQQQPFNNVTPVDTNVQGDWSNINAAVEGTKSFLDGGCMLDLSNTHNMTQARLNFGLNDVAGNSDVGYYEQGIYKGYRQY